MFISRLDNLLLNIYIYIYIFFFTFSIVEDWIS